MDKENTPATDLKQLNVIEGNGEVINLDFLKHVKTLDIKNTDRINTANSKLIDDAFRELSFLNGKLKQVNKLEQKEHEVIILKYSVSIDKIKQCIKDVEAVIRKLASKDLELHGNTFTPTGEIDGVNSFVKEFMHGEIKIIEFEKVKFKIFKNKGGDDGVS